MKNKILFDVNTPFQLLIACTVVEIYYLDNNSTILLLSNSLLKEVEKLKKRILISKLFKEIYIIDDQADKNSIIKQIENLELLKDVDTFHFTSYSSVFSCYLYNNLPSNTTIVLNEEGGATYNLFSKYEQFRILFPNLRADSIELSKLSKIFVLNKNLYDSQRKEIVESINMNEIKSPSLFVKKLNIIFNYTFKEVKEGTIFFTQNFMDYKVVKEKEVKDLAIKLKNIYKKDLIFKLHPFDKNYELYKSLNIKILNSDSQIPWELIIYNHILIKKKFNKNLLTVGSTSLAATSVYLRREIKYIKVKNILLSKLFITPFNEASESFYKNLEDKIQFEYYLPKSIKELKLLNSKNTDNCNI